MGSTRSSRPGRVWPSPGGRTPASTRQGRSPASMARAGRLSRALPEALNAVLPDDVAVLAAEEAPADFHARFSATGRSYRYVVLDSRVRAPLRARRALWWPRPVDEEALAGCAAALVGEHDFTAFTPTETQHEVFSREIRRAAWERRGDELHFTVTADSFLRHMVRTLVGTMLEHGRRVVRAAPRGPPARGGGTDRAGRGGLPGARRLRLSPAASAWLRSERCASPSSSSISTGR